MNRIFLAAMTALLTLTACGGSGGGGTTPGGGDDGGSGGIDGRGTAVVSQGQITGFGSIIVNGVEYETNGTEFEIDGETGTESELEIGDVVLVAGTVNDDGITGTATTVTFDDVVEGPVTAIDEALLQLTVLGQTVQVVDGETLFDDTPPLSFGPGIVGEIVEVSGYRLADGTVSATFIEAKPASIEYEVTGVISEVTASTFVIGGLTVDFSGAIPDNFPGVAPEDGQLVEAKGGTTLGPNGELLATRIEYKGNVLGGAAGGYVELEGYITRFGSATDFDVSGLPVTTTTGTIYEGGTSADLNVNLKVEVEGNVNTNGVLVAEKVEIKTATGIRVLGLVGSISPLEVFGIQINADDLTTRFDDKSELGLENMKLADIQVGNYLEVRGQEQPQGQITAFTIERDDPDPRRELRGFVTEKAQPNLTVLGVTIVTTDSTVYRDSRGATEVSMTFGDFWAAVQVGSRVDAQGTETDTTTLTATEVTLEGN